MSDSHTHDQPHGHGEHHAPFSEQQMKEFQKDDTFAGGAVVVLMSAIFSIGLILYTAILIVVS